MRTMTMRHRPRCSPRRSPPRFTRAACSCRRTLGDRRHAAQVSPGGLGMEALGVVAGGHERVRQPCRAQHRRGPADQERWRQEGLDPGFELGKFINTSASDAMGQARTTRPWWPRSPCRESGFGRSTLSFGHQCWHRETFQSATELLRSAVAEVAHLDEGLDPGLAGRALGHHEDSDGLDGTVSATWACRSPDHSGRLGPLRWRRGGSDLPRTPGVLAIRPVDLDDLDAHPMQVAGQTRGP